jgi:hypothetical protein
VGAFAGWAALDGHLVWWMREVADVRIHAGTGERPIDRFAREAPALRPLNDRPTYQAGRCLIRKVHSDACVEVDTHRYSVPWRLIGAEVRVEVQYGKVASGWRRCITTSWRRSESSPIRPTGASSAVQQPNPGRGPPALLRPHEHRPGSALVMDTRHEHLTPCSRA